MATGAPRYERVANGATTTLNGAILDLLPGNITLTDASDLPSTGDFRLTIGSEIVICDSRTANVVNVAVRGAEGTTAALHADATDVFHYGTNDQIERALIDCFGELEYPKNRILLAGDTKVDSDFTWRNQGGATSADANDGGLNLFMPSEAADQLRGKELVAPSPPYKVTAFVMMGPGFARKGGAGTGSSIGIFMREDSSNEYYYAFIRTDVAALWRMTNETTFSANVDSDANFDGHYAWIRLEDDNTNVRGYLSPDGFNWVELWNEGRTSFMAGGPDRIGFGCMSGNGAAGAYFHFKTWIQD